MRHFANSLVALCVLVMATVACYAQQPQPQEQAPPPPAPGITQVVPPPPLPPAPPEVLQADEGTFGIEPQIWIPEGHPIMDKGLQTVNTTLSHVVFPGKSKASIGGTVRVPAGRHNAIRLTYLDVKAGGTFIAPAALDLWGGGYNPGDSVVSDYGVRSFNISFDYLTWPYPPHQRRFRLKTLWQVQYINANSSFIAPASTNTTAVSSGSHFIILPALGLGVTEYLSKNLRVEANASGFAIPHHTAIANADADIAYTFGLIELHAGARLLYFKTSPQNDFYMKGRFDGAFVGLRLAWR